MDRRRFLCTAGGAGLAATLAPAAALSAREPTIQKAVKLGMVEEELSVLDKFRLLQSLGYDGVELSAPNELDDAEVIAARDATGLPIHGVVCSTHWRQPLSHPDHAVRQAGLDGLRAALAAADAYGASTVLLVPAVVDAATPYDVAWRRSHDAIRRVLPEAEERGIPIALENVWNNFLLSPMETATYIDAFESPWVGAYFDIGNVVAYGWPEQWIRVLGPRILKLDVKEYSRDKLNDEGRWAGFRVPLGEGSIDWAAVRHALAGIGYRGWATAEVPGGDRQHLADIAARMDRVFGIGN